MRGWQFAHVGKQLLMMLKPASGAYRLLNCSSLYGRSAALPAAAAAAGAAAAGVPCALVVEGALPRSAPCGYSREHCLLAPQCGWCQSSAQCVPADEEGVCAGVCPDGQLLFSTAAPKAGADDDADGACSAQLACDRCTEHPECGWCGGRCVAAGAAADGLCTGGGLVRHDASKCPLVEEVDF